MATSDIVVSGLAALGGVGQVSLTWNTPIDAPGRPTYLRKAAVEIHAASSNDRSLATKIGEQPASNSFLHSGLSRGATRYYWIKARTNGGLFGEWFPVSPTDGVVGMEANNDVLLETTGFFKNANGLIEQWGTVTTVISGDVQRFNFPTAFPTQCFNCIAIARAQETEFPGVVLPTFLNMATFDTSGFEISTFGVAGDGYALVAVDVFWQAKGN